MASFQPLTPMTTLNRVFIFLGTSTGSFAATTNFEGGSSAVAVGDFNGDGRQDLTVATIDNPFASTSVSIFLGTGTGSFNLRDPVFTGFPPIFGIKSLVVGDFNQDGRQDLAWTNQSTENVSIALGNGDGTFGAVTNFPAGDGPSSAAVGDFNGDGKQDLAVANVNSDNVSILLGDGMGSFGAATNFPAGDGPSSVATGDFNGDGKQDLAVANVNSDNVSILLGDGMGSFGAATNFPAGDGPSSVATGDFNGDGKQDLAVANVNSDNVSILLGDGMGSFGAATNFPAGRWLGPRSPQETSTGTEGRIWQ